MNEETDKPQSQEDAVALEQEHSAVKLRTQRIKKSRAHYEKDFKRMRENSDMAFGIQSQSQESLDTQDYRANFTNREVNYKVATLYARNPKAVYRRRPRLDFEIWDEDPVTRMAANAAMAQSQMMGMPPNPQAAMLLQDISQGEAWRKMVDRVGHTMEKLYEYQCDIQEPDFKYQMKQLVRRVVTCGVGYVRLNFCRLGESLVASSATDDSLSIRVKKAKLLLDQIEEDKIQDTDARVLEVQNLLASIQSSVQQGDNTNVEERLEFDFPDSTSIIVDPRCHSLKGFIGARWVAQQYIVPLTFVQSYFELPGLSPSDVQVYREDGVEKPKESQAEYNQVKEDPDYRPMVCLWELFELETKSYSFLVDGYKKYVQKPTPCDPCTNRFWPFFSLTFNDVEVIPGAKSTIYPPSDVDLLKSAQKSWNKSRQALEEHRNQSAPMYVTRAGWLTDDGPDSDKEKLKNHESGELVEIQGLPPEGDVNKALAAWKPAPIDPAVYDTHIYEQDATMVVGTNQPQPVPKAREAATPAVIAEQARISSSNSNADDLDDMLTELAGAAGEIMLREFSPQTVQRVVGKGAVWPDHNRDDFLNSIYLQHVASSSGRPNKAVETANFEKIAPLMLQAGANPWAVIREAVARLDDRLDPNDFAPTVPPPPPEGPQGPGNPKVPGPKPPPQPGGNVPHAQATGGAPGMMPHAGSNPVPVG